MNSKSTEEAEFQKRLALNRHLDNSKHQKNIRRIFETRKTIAKKQAKERISKSPLLIPPPKYAPKEFLGSTIYKHQAYTCRPPSQYVEKKRPVYSSISRKISTSHLEIPKSQNKNSSYKPHWPPPPDSNYQGAGQSTSTSSYKSDLPSYTEVPSSSVEPASFVEPVDCDLCGKKKLSGPKQLLKHQQSKKCLNRRDWNKVHYCRYCKKKFNTSHNLSRHNCENF